MKFLLLHALGALTFTRLSAQELWTGKITDAQGSSLAFTAILPNNDPSKGTFSDIEGRFTISSQEKLQSIVFRRIGMQTLILNESFLRKNNNRSLDIQLEPSNTALQELTITAGENPADALITKVIQARNRNNPEKLNGFQCQTYNKISFAMTPNNDAFKAVLADKDTTDKKIKKGIKAFDRLDKQTQQHDLFLMETVTERRFRFPNDNFETVILNRVSGFPNTGMVALANAVQPFSFYGDFLTILDKEFVNPISPGSPKRYFFNIEDTLYHATDTIFILSFHPRKGHIFEGLTGVLHINSKGWAVQNVRAEPSNKSHSNIKIEQQYQFDETALQWFPEQLNFELSFPKYPTEYLGMKVTGRSYVSKVKINPPLKNKDFNPETPLVFEPNAFGRPDTAWLPYRQAAPLSLKESRTYQWMDSLTHKKGYAFAAKAFEALATGKVPLTNILNLDLNYLFQSNNYEGTRLGIGLTTEPSYPLHRPKWWGINAYTGYGTDDKAWKYGAAAKFRISQSQQTNLQVHYAHDLLEPGTLPELDQVNFFSRRLYAHYLDANEEVAASLSSRLWRGLFARVSLSHQHLQPNYSYTFIQPDFTPSHNFQFTESTLYLKYAFEEKTTAFLGNEINQNNRFPVLELAYTHGFNNLLNGQYAYDKWTFALRQSVLIPRLGRLNWRVEGGIVNGSPPAEKLFTLNQTSGTYSLFYVPNTFQSIGDTFLLSNQFLNVYLRQELGNFLYRAKYSAPKLSLVQNMALGSLLDKERHKDLPFATPEKPLLESGILLDNLVKINYINIANFGLGGGAFYHWGYLQIPNWQKNVTFRLTASFYL